MIDFLKENAVTVILAIIAVTTTFTYCQSDLSSLKTIVVRHEALLDGQKQLIETVSRHEKLLLGYPLLTYRINKLEESITLNTKAVRSFMQSNRYWQRKSLENNKALSTNTRQRSRTEVDQELLGLVADLQSAKREEVLIQEAPLVAGSTQQ